MTVAAFQFTPSFPFVDPIPVYCPEQLEPGIAVEIKGRTAEGDFEVVVCKKEKRPFGILRTKSPGSSGTNQTAFSGQLRISCDHAPSIVWWMSKEEVKVGESVECNAEGKCVKLASEKVAVGVALSTGKNEPIEVQLF